MAVTQNTYTGNGSTTNFAFTFPYLKKADVKVKLDGTTRPTSEYTWFNATTIQMNTAPASGVVVLIYRDTSNDSKAGTFYAGSMIKAEDLNSNFDQILYVAQEVSNNAMSTLGTAEMQGNLAFGKSMGIVFEGDTNDAYETTLKVVDPTADRQLNLPNVSGTLVSTGDTGTVTGTMLADATIGTADLANSAVTTAKIAAEAVTADEIAGATITGTELAADCINGTKIADNSIDSEHYVDGSIDTEHIKDSQITTAKLADVNVTTAKIANDAVTNAKIADDQIDSEHYVDGSIDTAHIADLQVTTAKLAADAVTNAKIADDSIDSEHYVDGSIDTAHIADDQVTVGKLNIPRVETLAGMTSTTASTLAAATDLSASITNLNITQGMTKATSLTTTSDTEFPTSKAVNDRILTVTNALGGFVAIADKDNFPTAHPDPSGNAGTVVSISDAAGISVNSSGVGSLATRAGGSDAVIINGFPSALRGGATVGSATNANPYVLPSSVGLQVQTTTTAHTYDYHKYFINEEDANKLSGDIQDFQERYRVAASAPTASKDDGDLWFDTTNNKMMVYDATASAWSDVATPGNFSINTISSYSGTGGNSATFNGTAYRFVLSTPPTQSAAQMVVSINGVIQKPNAGTSQPSEGFAIDGNSIIFSNAPASGSDYFIITLGNSVDIGTPSDNVITTAMLQNSAVTTAKITNDAVDGTKIADDAVGAEHIEVLDSHLQFADNSRAKFGTGDDLTIHHDGTGSHIINSTNDLTIQNTGDDVYIKAHDDFIVYVEGGAEKAIVARNNGEVELYYNDSKKLETTSDGITVSGSILANDDVTFAGANYNVSWDKSADYMQWGDNAKAVYGAGADLQIYHNGTKNWIEAHNGDIGIAVNGGNEHSAAFIENGGVELYYDNSKKFETTSYGVLHQGGAKADGTGYFKVNDDGDFYAGNDEDLKIYHDGSNSYIDNSTGTLRVRGSAVRICDTSNNTFFSGESSSSKVYHNDSVKLETTSAGVEVTGKLTFANDGLANGSLDLGADADLNLYHDNTHAYIDNNTGNLYIRNDGNSTTESIHIQAKGGEEGIVITANGKVQVYDNGVCEFETTNDGIHSFGGVTMTGECNQVGQGDKYFDSAFLSHTLHFRRISDGDSGHSNHCTVSSAGVWSADFNDTSDEKLKENITTISDGAISTVKQLRPVTFDWKETDKANNVSGFIAQEVKTILPNLVYGDEYDPTLKDPDRGTKGGIKGNGYSINTIGIVAHLTKALQEAVTEIETLKTKVAALEAA